jgi:hypothetical protein
MAATTATAPANTIIQAISATTAATAWPERPFWQGRSCQADRDLGSSAARSGTAQWR